MPTRSLEQKALTWNWSLIRRPLSRRCQHIGAACIQPRPHTRQLIVSQHAPYANVEGNHHGHENNYGAPPDDHAEPAWEVALLFPAQGEWSEDDYLWLTDHTRRLVEFTEGHIEVLPMPTDEHQRIVLFLYRALYAFLAARGIGIVLVAPLRLRLRTGRYREPDVLLLLSANRCPPQ